MLARYLLAGILLVVMSQVSCTLGESSNDGFTDVVTAPASSPSLVFQSAGTFAPGVGPVFGQGGLVYIGNEQGSLFALRPEDHQVVWSSQLPNGRVIKASAVVGADGSIYVVGVTGRGRRNGTLVGQQVTLYKFNPGGGLVWQTDFPAVNQENGYTTAPPNIWSSGGTEVIMVPAIYRTPVSLALHLDAFTTSGELLADQVVVNTPEMITTDGGLENFLDLLACNEVLFIPCLFLVRYSSAMANLSPPHVIDFYEPPPLPGVATFTSAGGGTPWVIVSDGIHDLVGYNFDPTGRQFIERFRAHDPARQAISGPMVLPDGHSVLGTDDGTEVGRITFSGPNGLRLMDVSVPGDVDSTPSRTANGAIVAVGYAPGGGFVTMLNSDGILHRGFTTGQTFASAAVSRTHIFVASASALATFEAGSLRPIQLFLWTGGGLWPPVIGPDGRVYAIVSQLLPPRPPGNVFVRASTLFIFPPPGAPVASRAGGFQNGVSTVRSLP